MRIHLSKSNFLMNFENADKLATNFSGLINLPEKVSRIRLNARGPMQDWDIKFLFDYEVFPSNILQFHAEWKGYGRCMEVGDIIIQNVMIPPIKFGVCLEFAVRITKLINETNKIGFVYETLSGHVERGISEFYFESCLDGQYFTIQTYSEPAQLIARLTKNFIALPYQEWCTKQALKFVKNKFEELNG